MQYKTNRKMASRKSAGSPHFEESSTTSHIGGGRNQKLLHSPLTKEHGHRCPWHRVHSSWGSSTRKNRQAAPTFLTSAINLIQLQKHLKGMAKQMFEFRSTRNGTRILTKLMVVYQAVKAHFENTKLAYRTSFL
jgi:hypothetical protein